MPIKLVTYNSQNYAGTLGSGLLCTFKQHLLINTRGAMISKLADIPITNKLQSVIQIINNLRGQY